MSLQFVRVALRQLRLRPGFAAVAILTLALGIGANSAVFTVVYAVLLNPLPYRDPSRLVALLEHTPQFPTLSVTRYNYDDWRTRSHSFSGMGAVRATAMTIIGNGDPERVPAKMMTASLLPLLGVSVVAGRRFGEDDDRPGAAPVALLSNAFRQRRFGDANPINTTITLDNNLYTIIGVLSPQFELFAPADIYVPFGPWAATLPPDRGWHPGIVPIARLVNGATVASASNELNSLAKQIETEHPNSNKDVGVVVNRVDDQLVQNVRPALLVLLGAVALVLLIACANVANLLLARAVGRQKEIAIRTALGAARSRIVGELVVESLVLGTLGGLVGLGVAWSGVRLLTGTVVTGLPRAQAVAVSWPVVFFTLAMSLVTALIFGLVPALQASRVDIRELLSQDGRGGGSSGPRNRRLRSTLIVSEVALALILLVGASVLIRSFAALTSRTPGFEPSHLLVIDLPLSPLTYREHAARTLAVEQVLDRVRALPGVATAGTTTMLPMAGAASTIHFNRTGLPPHGPSDYLMAGFRAVSPEYLATLQVPLKRGRMLTAADREGAAHVVVINESMARQCYPDREALGQHIQLGTEPSPDTPTMEIVGIVGDMKQSFDAGGKAEMFVPYLQYPPDILAGMYRNTTLVVRTAGEPLAIANSVRERIRQQDPNQPLVNVRSMDQAVANTVAQPRLQTTLLTVFAGIAVLLALVGVYGVMAYLVSQRTPEIGVRLALGASPSSVVRMIVWQGARLAFYGIVLGVAVALVATRQLERMAFTTPGWDFPSFVAAALALGLAAVAASYLPARRAARVAPMTALGTGAERR